MRNLTVVLSFLIFRYPSLSSAVVYGLRTTDLFPKSAKYGVLTQFITNLQIHRSHYNTEFGVLGMVKIKFLKVKLQNFENPVPSRYCGRKGFIENLLHRYVQSPQYFLLLECYQGFGIRKCFVISHVSVRISSKPNSLGTIN